MKGLKIGAIIAGSLLLVSLLFLWYFFMTATVSVVSITSKTQAVSQNLELFETLQTAVDQNTFVGTIYQKPISWDDADAYACHIYTIQIANGCLVPIDMVEVQVVPLSDDIIQQSDLEELSIGAKDTGTITATILTKATTNASRELIVTYYVWGVSFQIRTTYVA